MKGGGGKVKRKFSALWRVVEKKKFTPLWPKKKRANKKKNCFSFFSFFHTITITMKAESLGLVSIHILLLVREATKDELGISILLIYYLWFCSSQTTPLRTFSSSLPSLFPFFFFFCSGSLRA